MASPSKVSAKIFPKGLTIKNYMMRVVDPSGDAIHRTYSKVNDAALPYDTKTKISGARQRWSMSNFCKSSGRNLDYLVYYGTLDLKFEL